MPSKLYGALAAGRPVVFIGDPEGDVARIVRDGPGLVARPEAMPALAGRCARCAAIPRASRAWAPPPGTPTRPAPRNASLDAWTRCLRAAARPPRRARSRSRWRRNDRPCPRAPPHRRRRSWSLHRAGDPGQPQPAWRITWHVASALAFQSALVLPSRWKAAVLRAFGARIGDGPGDQAARHHQVSVVFGGRRPRLARRRRVDRQSHHGGIGSHVCISQGAYLSTGNHDWNDPRFRFFCQPITLEDGVWVAREGRDLPRQRARPHERGRRRRGVARHDRAGARVHARPPAGAAATIGVMPPRAAIRPHRPGPSCARPGRPR